MQATRKSTAYPMVSSSPIPSLNDVSVLPEARHQHPGHLPRRDVEARLREERSRGDDLATGEIVDEISRSPYWRDSAIFVVEEDSQEWVDHVDGHRSRIQIISPWAQHGVVDGHYYSQITMIRTIEADPRDPPDAPAGHRGDPDDHGIH